MAKNQGETVRLSTAHEDYLRAIYLLQQQGVKATNHAISGQLGVTPASATNMIKHLAALNLVAYAPYHGVELTPTGQRMALAIVRYHRLLELYLAEALGLPWEKVHTEADRLEHAISEDLAEALSRALGDPALDPHGDPIPRRDGTLPPTTQARLADFAPGSTVTLTRVGVQDENTLRDLGAQGLRPGAVLKVQARTEDGSLEVEVAGRVQRIAPALAPRLYVQPDPAGVQ